MEKRSLCVELNPKLDMLSVRRGSDNQERKASPRKSLVRGGSWTRSQICYSSELVGEIIGEDELTKRGCIKEDEQRDRAWFWRTSKGVRHKSCIPRLSLPFVVMISRDSSWRRPFMVLPAV